MGLAYPTLASVVSVIGILNIEALCSSFLRPISFTTQQYHHILSHGFQRFRFRDWSPRPQLLGLYPLIHPWVRLLSENCPFATLPIPLHRFPDEQLWSVFLRRLKTPLNEDKSIRVLRTSDS